MNRWFSLILLVLLLASCTIGSSNIEGTETSLHITTSPSSEIPIPTVVTQTPTFVPKISPVFVSATPTPTMIQPLIRVLQAEILNTPTATFDVSHAATHTPGVAAKCPIENPNLILDKDILFQDIDVQEKEKFILDFLNNGGSMQSIFSVYTGEGRTYKGDLTGDGFPELVIPIRRSIYGDLYFIGCKDGKYQTLYNTPFHGDYPPYIIAVKDMNLDGLPEMVIYSGPNDMGSSIFGYQIVGWDGQSIRSLISQTEFQGLYSLDGVQDGWIFMNGVSRNSSWRKIKDIDHNGTLEFIVTGGLAVRRDDLNHGPYRAETDIYMWNGDGFVLNSIEIEPPQYRFQAVQDGDLYTLFRQYDKALNLYRQAILNDKLEWWSAERSEYNNLIRYLDSGYPKPTLPAPDVNEYPNLAAYAHYRLMLLYRKRA